VGISARAVGRLIGVSHVAVIKAHQEGRITRLKDGTYDPATVVREWEARTDLRNGRNAFTGSPKGFDADIENGGGGSLQKSRAVVEAFRAGLLRLEYMKRSGALVSASDMKRASFDEARRCRERLNSIPDRLAPVLVGMDDQRQIHKLISEEIHTALIELSGFRNGDET